MKKSFFLVLLFMLTLVGCNTKNEKINIIIPNGSPTIAFGKIINEQNQYNFDIVSGPDLLLSAFTSKSHDVIVAPITLGAKLFNNNNTDYKLYGILTTGNNYIISKKEMSINEISELNNQNILAYGQNNVPDIILRKVLADNSISSNITYEASVDALVSKFVCDTSNPNKICDSGNIILSAEPTISQLKLKYNVELNIISLQEEFKKTTSIEVIPQAAILVNPNAKNLKGIMKLLERLENDVNYLNDNPKKYANEISSFKQFVNMDEEIIASSIPGSSIVFLKGIDNIKLIEDYFAIINEFNSKILDNKIPSHEFYYE